MNVPVWAWLLVGLIGGGGIAGLVTAVIKVRPEANQILMTTAQGAVVVQSGVIDELREQRDEDRKEREREKREEEARRAVEAHRYAETMRRMGKRLDDAIGEVAHLREEVTRCEELRGELAVAREQLAGAQRELAAAQAQIEELNQRLEAAGLAVKAANDERDKALSEVVEMRGRVDDLEAQVLELRNGKGSA